MIDASIICRCKPLNKECEKCELIKPERAHHCQMCDSCIYLMDHHCNWIANCVGALNFKFFILSLFYGNLVLFFYCVTFWECAAIYVMDLEASKLLSFIRRWYVTL